MKNSKLLLTGLEIHQETGVIRNGYIFAENGIISEIGEGKAEQEQMNEILHYHFTEGQKAIPGFIDLHIHGAGGADVMDASSKALDIMTSRLPQEGTTAFLATTMTAPAASIERALIYTAEYIENNNHPGEAEILGIHLEGPFLSPKRAGAQNPEDLISPDIELFNKWQDKAKGYIRQVTLAPEEKEGLELVKHLAKNTVIPSVGHSDASYETMVKAMEYGAKQATHLFNGMSPLHHRDPGVAGTVLMEDALKAEIIVDGIHVHPQVVEFVFRTKGKEGLLLITDSMRAKCLGDGCYDLGGQQVRVDGGRATLSNGVLAGSMLKMNIAARNMKKFSSCNLSDIIHMASINPAKQLGIFNRKGSIEMGKDADIIIMDDDFQIEMTFCKGKAAYLEGSSL